MMKKIINPWSGNPKYNCFGCSTNNPFGLHMEFYEDGDYLVKWDSYMVTWRNDMI